MSLLRLSGLELFTPTGSVQLLDALIGSPTLTRRIDGGSTVEMTVSDEMTPSGRLLRTSGALVTSWVHLEDLTFQLHRSDVQGDNIALTFLDQPVKLLKGRRGRYVNPPGRTRVDFVRHLCSEVGVAVLAPDTVPPAAVAPERGTEDEPDGQDSMDAIRAAAETVAWRAFSSGRLVHFGPDDWLLTRQSPLPVRARTGGVQDLDWTLDEGLDADTLTFQVALPDDSQPFGWSQGMPISVSGEGPGDGLWLVTETTGPLLGEGRMWTIECERRQQPLPEPTPTAADDVGDVSTLALRADAGGAPAANAKREQMVQAAIRRAEGKPYLWGGNGPGAYDCSGLVQEASRDAGRVLPKSSFGQWDRVKRQGTPISVAEALRTRGALLFRIGKNPNHVAISLGDGRTVEARSRRDGCGIFSGASSRHWTSGGLWL